MVFSISLGAVVVCRLGWLPAVPHRVLVSLPEIRDIWLLEEPVSFEIVLPSDFLKDFPICYHKHIYAFTFLDQEYICYVSFLFILFFTQMKSDISYMYK